MQADWSAWCIQEQRVRMPWGGELRHGGPDRWNTKENDDANRLFYPFLWQNYHWLISLCQKYLQHICLQQRCYSSRPRLLRTRLSLSGKERWNTYIRENRLKREMRNAWYVWLQLDFGRFVSWLHGFAFATLTPGWSDWDHWLNRALYSGHSILIISR